MFYSSEFPDALSNSQDQGQDSQGQEATRRSNDFSWLVRVAQSQDLVSLAEVLTSSFHPTDGMMGWLYPLLRLGIHEDLRGRLRNPDPHYVCLVAVKPLTRQQLDQGADRHRSPWSVQEIARSPQLAFAAMATHGDPLVGTVELSLRHPSFWSAPPWSAQPGRYVYLSNLAVHPAYRQRGVAQQLLQTCDRIAQDWGFQDLYLHVLDNNDRARRLYLKAGYRLQEVEAGLGSWFLGRPRQLLLRKRL